jgi:hypothetical protein
MASRVEIANLALTKIGSGQKITSLTDNSAAARAMNTVYDMTRKAELRARNWAFALKRAQLPASSVDPSWGFTKAYPLPADFLRLVQANEFYLTPALLDYNTADASPFAIEQGQILCDYSAPLKIRYVYDVTDEGTFDALFVNAFAARLAYETCEQITNSTGKKQDIKADYLMAVATATKANAIEKPPALIGDDSWVMARL